jgi:hypothetical protein
MTTPSCDPFAVKYCALAAIATGERAGSLMDLRDRLATTHPGCFYFHFWGARLHSHFTHPEYHNDFADWTHRSLHDYILAERLNAIDPTDYEDLESLRHELLELVEQRLEETEITWTKQLDQFYFIRSQIIVFATSLHIPHPKDLPAYFPQLSPSSIYYHFIDATGRNPKRKNDFSSWLQMFGEEYKPLIEQMESVDPYFLSLNELKHELNKIINEFYGIA